MKITDDLICEYIKAYKKGGEPIQINFRELIPSLNNADRATHLIHSYPAKLLMHIPYFFINNNIFTKEGDRVLDSFCGSGTVLLEAAIAGRIPFGADANPLARLISRTKVRSYDINALQETTKIIVSKKGKFNNSHCPTEINVDFWFLPEVKKQLLELGSSINSIQDKSLNDFFSVCYSNLVKKVSLADPRVSVPVRLNPYKYPENHVLRSKSIKVLKDLETINLKEKFLEIVKCNIERFERLNKILSNRVDPVLSEDARTLMAGSQRLSKNSVKLVISSPPYAGAQKYVRSSSLSLGWLGYAGDGKTIRSYDALSIGRENYSSKDYTDLIDAGIKKADLQLKRIHRAYPKRAHIAANYLIEMRDAFKEAVRVLKPGGTLVLVIANNQVCGEEFKTQEYLCSILEGLGMTVLFKLIDDIRSYGLMTKRNKTASIITSEYILVFEKNKE